MSKRHLDDRWKAWLDENIERRCNPEQLLGILLKNNFTLSSIRECMGDKYPANSALVAGYQEENSSGADHKALSELRIAQPDNGIGAVRLETGKAQVYTIDNFLTDEECNGIVAIIRKNLRPSTVTREHPTDKYYRTSSTCDLGLLKDDVIRTVDDKICRVLGIRPAYAEATQGQHYETGQEFKQHKDYFEPSAPESEKYIGTRGQRTWTFMIYLNTVAQGGGTHFPKLNHTFQPQKGRAVVWNNLCPDGIPNPNTLHAGMPVTEGHKDIITKWFREKGQGPMFY